MLTRCFGNITDFTETVKSKNASQNANQPRKHGGNMVGIFDLASRFKVFPCRADKRPYTANGYKDATSDPDTLLDWERRFPGALIGIPCAPNGIFALDVDVLAALDELAAGHPPFEVGPIQSTPRGGLHLVFRLPANVKVPNNAGKLGPGLDLRSDGYICTGSGYKWHEGHGWDFPITDAPEWLLEKIAALGEKPQAVKTTMRPTAGGDVLGADYWLQKYLALASPGNRNEHGFLLACQLRDAGLSQGEAEGYMIRYAAGVPGAGYSEGEALASLAQAYKAPRRDAIELKPLPNYTFYQAPETGQAKPYQGAFTEQASAGELVTDGGESLIAGIRETQEERKENMLSRRWVCGTYLRLPSRNPGSGKFTSARFRCGHCHSCRMEKGKFWREQVEALVANFEDGILLVEGLTEEQAQTITSELPKEQYSKFPNVTGVYTIFVERNAAQSPEARELIFDYGYRLTIPRLEKLSLSWWADLANVSDHGERRASGKLIRIKKVAEGENEHANGKLYEFAGFLGPTESQFADAMAYAAARIRADFSSEVGYQAYISRFFDYMASRLSSKNVRFTRKSIERKVDLAILRDSQKIKSMSTRTFIDLNPEKAVTRALGGAISWGLQPDAGGGA
jgi:hypothetical protein